MDSATRERKIMTNNTHNHTIDVIKGLAIILVLITHYNWTADQRQFVLFPYVIDMAIPIFMIITGFVYANSLRRGGVSGTLQKHIMHR